MLNVVPPASVKKFVVSIINAIRAHIASLSRRALVVRVGALVTGAAAVATLFAVAAHSAPVPVQSDASVAAADIAQAAVAGGASASEPTATAAAPTTSTSAPTTKESAPKTSTSAPAAETSSPKASASSVPSGKELNPVAVEGKQSSFTPSTAQMKNVRTIVETGQKLDLPARAWVIAVATASQESHLTNLGDLGSANDHDSLGLFQQRPSSGWGSASQVQNPKYASTKFYQSLTEVSGWKKMSLTDAAQEVQVSAFPDAYAKWEKYATNLVLATYGQGPYAKIAAKA